MSELLFSKQKRLDILFYLMIVFALIGPSLGVPISDGFNLTFFRIAFLLVAAGIALRFAAEKKLETSYMYPVRWYGAFFLFWFAYGVIALSWSASLSAGVRYLFLLGMMLPLAYSFPFFLKSTDYFWKTLRILFWVFAAIILFAVFESITLIHLPQSRAFGRLSASVTSVFRNQNDLATCITLGLPFLASSFYMLDLKRKHKWFIYIIGILSIYTLIATGSRSNTFFALPLAALPLVVLLPQVMDRSKITMKNVFKAIIAVLVAFILANGLSMVFLSAEAREQAKTKLSSTFGFLMDVQNSPWTVEEGGEDPIDAETGRSATVRKFLILNGLRFLHQSHYMGVGPGNVEVYMDGAPKVDKVNMHNWWGEVLVNFGVIIFILYMSLYFLMLWRLWKLASLKHSPELNPVLRWGAYATIAALTGYFFGGMAPSTAIHYTPMWICYGIGLAIIAIGETLKKKHSGSEREKGSLEGV